MAIKLDKIKFFLLKKYNEYLYIFEWLKRNSIWFVIGLIAFYILGYNQELINTILTVAILEAITIAFCGIAIYCITNLNFITIKKTNDRTIIGWIILAVHIGMGLSVYSIYMLEGIKGSILP